MPITKLTPIAFEDNVKFRNIIINGDMSIAQRGTSTASITSASYPCIDRMKFAPNSMGTWTASQDTDVPSGQGFSKSLKLDCTVADASPAAGDYIILQQLVEGQMLQYLKKGTSNATSVTMSFWVKSNKTGIYILNLYDADNTRTISKSYTINSASTWEKKTITFAGDTSGTLDNDNGSSLQINFWLGAGSTYTSGTLNTSWNSNTNADRAVGQVNLADDTANEWYITGVQLEAGEVASDFEFLPVDINKIRCERYHQRTQAFIGAGHATSGTIIGEVSLNVEMRATPSASQSGNFVTTDGYTNDYTQTSTSITRYGNSADTRNFMIALANFNSAMTAAKPYFARHSNSSVLIFDSEL